MQINMRTESSSIFEVCMNDFMFCVQGQYIFLTHNKDMLTSTIVQQQQN